VLAWGPGDEGGDLDADQAAWEDVKGGFVAAVEEGGADVCCAQAEEVEGARGDEVVPARLALASRWTGHMYQDVRRKSQWKKKKRTKSSATVTWVALKNS
jgi:hypothetical protein